MSVQIKKIGNSKGIIISAAILEILDIKEREKMSIKVRDKEIILTKIDGFDPKSLEELFLDYKGTYKGERVFDDTKGREVW